VKNYEVPFEISELFFSKTDHRGIIESGNTVFVRVSEYLKEELLNRPHNIIRHENMPRSIFRLFWSFLKDQRAIAAYVKNKSKNGKYYWVFAMAFPMADGYLSIRIKPSSEYFQVIQDLYGELLEVEKSFDSKEAAIEAGMSRLTEKLNALGFQDYEDFMKKALLAELSSRDILIGNSKGANSKNTLSDRLTTQIWETSNRCIAKVRQSFTKAYLLSESTAGLFKDSELIVRTGTEVKFVTLNLTVASAKLGDIGRPLSVVSNNLEKLTSDILETTVHFQEVFKSYEKSVYEMHFSIAASRLQIEMMNQLSTEIIAERGEDGSLDDTKKRELILSCHLLKSLIRENFKNVDRRYLELSAVNKSLLSSIQALSKTTNGMGVIHVVGKIEMSRAAGSSEALNALLEEMAQLNDRFKNSLKNLEAQCRNGVMLSAEFDKLNQDILLDLQGLDSHSVA
jgi:aerotaxis receptor